MSTMQCSVCGTANPENAKFCFNCGNALRQAQPAPVPVAAPPLLQTTLSRLMPRELLAKMEAARAGRAMEGERRIVTILFCDVQGSTAMAEDLDPEDWAEIMNGAFSELIAPVYRYEGTVARLMGDAILAFFGAPIAHEDDPRRAILAGLEIVERIDGYRRSLSPDLAAGFGVRVGINTGLVRVGEVGSDLRVEYTAMGDAVNTASRMEQTAAPGTVQIAANTFRMVQGLFDLDSLGGIEVKGKSDPVQAYRVMGVREGALPVRGIEGLSSPLVGREQEMRALRSSVDDLMQGRGQIVSVMGDAGLGKSRLIAELRQSLVDDGLLSPDMARSGLSWLEGRSFSYETSVPYTPFSRMLHQLFRFDRTGNDEEKYEWLKASVWALMPDRVIEVAPYLAVALGIDVRSEDGEMVRHLEPPLLRGRVFNAVSQLIVRLAEARPLVLVFEDLHWADAVSLDLLEVLMALSDSVPLLLIALFRPQREERSWRFHEAAQRDYARRYRPLLLQPLDRTDSRTLVANLLHIEDLPEKVRSLILEKAEGNPFFVEEVIRSLLDAGLVVQEDGHWRATRDIEDVKVPDTLAGVITARLDRVEEEPRRVAQTASVVGREFHFDILSGVYDFPECLEDALSDLERRELVLERNRAPEHLYAFKHVLTQETAYNSILHSRRRELHRRVAESLERLAPDRVPEIARNFLEAREEVRALPYVVAAGEGAARAYSTQAAIEWFRQALFILPKADDVGLGRRAYEGLARALELTGDVPGVIETYDRMYEFGDAHADVPTKVSALNKRAFVRVMRMGQIQEIQDDLGEAERLARAEQDGRGLVELATLRCGTCLPMADFGGAIDALGASADLARQMELKQELALALGHSALTFVYMLRFDDAQRAIDECLRVADEIGDLEKVAEVLSSSAVFLNLRNGDLDGAYEAAREGWDIGRRIGALFHECTGRMGMGMSDLARGNLSAAVEELEDASRIGGMLGPFAAPIMPMILSSLGSAYLAISPRLYQSTAEKHARPMEQMEPFAGATAWAIMGFCALELGDLGRAEELFEKGLAVPSMTWLFERPRLLAGSAIVRVARGDVDGAAGRVREARAYAEQHGLRHFMPFIALAEAQVAFAGRDVVRALDRFAEAERQAAQMGARLLLWQSRSGAAQVLEMAGRHEEAEERRRQALQVIDEMASLFRDQELRTAFLESTTGKGAVQRAES